MFSDLIRTIIGSLSSWYPNKIISFNKDAKLRKEIIKKINKIKLQKKNLKKTHKEFNTELIILLKSNKIKNFLRENFIQKMFFVQNRFFVFQELINIKKSKKWDFYKSLLIEDHIGNPIRYFLYFKSSGNRINHIYHLKVLEDELKIDLKRDINVIFEFGAGYGLMARIFSKINKKIKYICFDTNFVNLLQYYYLSHNKLDVGFSNNYKFFLTSKINNFQIKHDLFIANWSFSEVPLNLRKKFINLMKRSKFLFISFQEKFEDIDNLKYFKELETKFSNKYEIKIIKNKFYKGNIFFKQNHYFFIAKKL